MFLPTQKGSKWRLHVKYQDVKRLSKLRASRGSGIPCKNHAKKNSHNPRSVRLAISVPKKIYIIHKEELLCKNCANKYLHNSVQSGHIPPRVKTFHTHKNGHRGTVNKGCSRTEKEYRQDLGHFLTAKETLSP